MRTRILLAWLLSAAILLSGCGSGDAAGFSERSTEAETSNTYRETRPFLDAFFHGELAQGDGAALIDVSAVKEGYVAVSATAKARLKFQIIIGEETYSFNLASDGTPSVFPLSCGSGDYLFRVMENIVENRYAEIASVSCHVEMLDEYQPFLRPSDYVSYNSASNCVKKAADLSSRVKDDKEFITSVYQFICSSVTYDYTKASNVQSGYLPNPDDVMSSGKGICFDYAALAAAMLRSQGIPTKMIFGYVSPDGLYHAWNMFYTEETGWVKVGFVTSPDGWTRMDATFAANGANDTLVGDGNNYSDLYCY